MLDREGTPEHTTHYESCGCAEARVRGLEAEVGRLRTSEALVKRRMSPLLELHRRVGNAIDFPRGDRVETIRALGVSLLELNDLLFKPKGGDTMKQVETASDSGEDAI